MTVAPYVITKRLNGEVAIYELAEIKDGIPIYSSPVTTEVRTELHAVKLAKYLTIGAEEAERDHP